MYQNQDHGNQKRHPQQPQLSDHRNRYRRRKLRHLHRQGFEIGRMILQLAHILEGITPPNLSIFLPDEWVGHSSAIGNLIQCVSGGYWKRNGASFQVAFDSLLLHLGTSHTASHCKGPEKAAATSGWIKSGTSQCRSQGKETWLQRRNRHKNHLVLLAYDLAIGWGVVLQLLLGLSGGDWIVGNNGSRCGPVRNLLQPTNASLHEVSEIRDAQTWPSKISLSWETKCHKLFVAPARNSGPWHGHRDPQHVPRQLQAGDVWGETYIPSPFSARFRPMFSAQMNHPMANPRSATARSQSKRHEWDLHDRAINTSELRPMFRVPGRPGREGTRLAPQGPFEKISWGYYWGIIEWNIMKHKWNWMYLLDPFGTGNQRCLENPSFTSTLIGDFPGTVAMFDYARVYAVCNQNYTLVKIALRFGRRFQQNVMFCYYNGTPKAKKAQGWHWTFDVIALFSFSGNPGFTELYGGLKTSRWWPCTVACA